MFNPMKKFSSKSEDNKVTSDHASTFSSSSTLKPDHTPKSLVKAHPASTEQSAKKEKTGFLTKLGTKGNGLWDKLEADTPMGRSKALQKELKEAGDTDKGPRDNNPTYPVIYVV
jgi:hypothetical protein